MLLYLSDYFVSFYSSRWSIVLADDDTLQKLGVRRKQSKDENIRRSLLEFMSMDAELKAKNREEERRREAQADQMVDRGFSCFCSLSYFFSLPMLRVSYLFFVYISDVVEHF